MIHARGQHQQQIVQKQRLVVQVELDGPVVELDIGHFGDDVFKVSLTPGLCRVRHHGQNRVIVLLVFVVEEHQFGP